MTPAAIDRMLYRPLRWLVLLLCVQGILAGTSAADPVVVLPMTSTSPALQIYETATATAIASELTKQLGSPAHAVWSASDVSKDVRVIVDGRLVSMRGDRVKLEASVRRVTTGQSVATIATRAMPSTDLDALVAELTGKLVPAVRRALEPPAAILLPTAIVQGTRVEEVGASTPEALVPGVLLLAPTGTIAHGVVSVAEPATAGALEMLARMGLRSTRSRLAEAPDVLAVVAELKATGASYALLVDVRKVSFSYNAVLSARGRVRVLLIGRDGLPVIDKNVATDTLVGGRGDKHQAMVYRVVDQAFDMVLPEFRRLLSEAAP